MILSNDKCCIEIKTDDLYTIDSADNSFQYDIVLNPDSRRHNDLYKTLAIHIDLFTKEYDIALIGSAYSYDIQCAILKDDILSVLQNDAITCINIADGTIPRRTRLDTWGINYAIYETQKGYLIYGELEITMLDNNFGKIWSFSGKDVLTEIRLNETSIYLCDFETNSYELDYDGNLIG